MKMALNIEVVLRVQQRGSGVVRLNWQPTRNTTPVLRIQVAPPRLALPVAPQPSGVRVPAIGRGRRAGPGPTRAQFGRLSDSKREIYVAGAYAIATSNLIIPHNTIALLNHYGSWEGQPVEEVAISMCSAVGLSGPCTLTLKGFKGNREVTVLVDSGASHNFISDKLVRALQLDVDHTSRLGVKLGDGCRTEATGLCCNLPTRFDDTTVTADYYVFPLGGIDMILGVAWLRTLGKMTVDWEEMYLSFNTERGTVRLEGDGASCRAEAPLKVIMRDEDVEIRAVLLEPSHYWVVSTVAESSEGNVARVYAQNSGISPKVDVYAFGVVLYELISAKEAIVKGSGSASDLRGLVALFEEVLSKPEPSEDLRKLIDPRLEDNYLLDSVQKMAQLAKACTHETPQLRPSMRSIVVALMTLSSTTEDWDVGSFYGNQGLLNLMSGR
ncbi:hypothetical protein BUALT_Bualt18G0012000 [Buddleja alternifolia]|uniref:Protein kinase domain-containing protein n=1 Tax=Buddleja alternifolia TaxID=168488 RepID=A0AAV6WA69_9LAMI|nr:hypothetical protein BUALT_Bualt18G0012000 [Buddleja alternifolia]